MSLLTTEQVTQLLDEVGAAVDAAGGSFTSNYTTFAVALTRT
jgi:hypothetical protein